MEPEIHYQIRGAENLQQMQGRCSFQMKFRLLAEEMANLHGKKNGIKLLFQQHCPI